MGDNVGRRAEAESDLKRFEVNCLAHDNCLHLFLAEGNIQIRHDSRTMLRTRAVKEQPRQFQPKKG